MSVPHISQQATLERACRLLRDAWAAGRKDRLQERVDDLSLPHEVRMFACSIASGEHLRTASELPHVVFQIGRFALTAAPSRRYLSGTVVPTPSAFFRVLPDRQMFWESEYRFSRRMAGKYGLDFEHRACFWGQVHQIGRGIRDDWSAQDVEVPMQSGQTALYRLTKHDDNYGGTGQKIWRFTFLRYLPNTECN